MRNVARSRSTLSRRSSNAPRLLPLRANASRGANRTYEKLVADILKEAEETDRWEDGLFGADRGDEPPEHTIKLARRRPLSQS